MDTPNEWTLMFFFAGDNALAPVIVSQLKAIKDAGFQENTDVVVHFDPNEIGAPTRIYDVNRKRKRNRNLPNTLIGDGEDPFVRNLEEDDVKVEEITADEDHPASLALSKALQNPDGVNAKEALINFLGFCRENHRAKHYILFLNGHGIIVANDAFLPDENPVTAITLKDLDKEILRPFADDVKKDGDAFELLALHSCSMSAIEVAYQLKDTANFMMASEGISFVGSWPYRQLLKKVFKTVKDAREEAQMKAKAKGENQDEAAKNPQVDVETLMEKLYFLSLFNATDYMLSGYSLDVSLCSLAKGKFVTLKGDIQQLVVELKKALQTARGKELILLAHWEAQSYWGEIFTDLFDFCRCLRERCNTNNELQELSTACFNVMERLKPIDSKKILERFNALVIHSDNFGSKYQYSHGLSVYFPWSRPLENAGNGNANTNDGILDRYKDYEFETDLGGDSWLSFLESYFEETKREKTRRAEDIEAGEKENRIAKSRSTEFSIAFNTFDQFGPLATSLAPEDPDKTNPITGPGCACPSIKNYPQVEEKPKKKSKKKLTAKEFSITESTLEAFE